MLVQELLENNRRETFRFIQHHFDIDAIRKAIKDGIIKPKFEPEFDITQWAEGTLGLKKGNASHKPFSMMMRVDYDYLDKIDDTRMSEPVYFAQIPGGYYICIDGNHRIAKSYMAGKEKVPAYLITQAQVKKAQSPNARKVKEDITHFENFEHYFVKHSFEVSYYDRGHLRLMPVFHGDELEYDGICEDPGPVNGLLRFETVSDDPDGQFTVYAHESMAKEGMYTKAEYEAEKKKRGRGFLKGLMDLDESVSLIPGKRYVVSKKGISWDADDLYVGTALTYVGPLGSEPNLFLFKFDDSFVGDIVTLSRGFVENKLTTRDEWNRKFLDDIKDDGAL